MGDDDVQRVAIAPDGAMFAVGTTRSADFATAGGGLSAPVQGLSDFYVAKLAPGGAAWEYVTVIGGSGEDQALGPWGPTAALT